MQMHVTLPNPPLLWHDFQTPAAKPNYSVVCSPLQIDTCMFPPWIISHAGEIHEKWRFKTLFQINKSTSYSSHFSMSDWVTQPLRTVNVAHQEKQLPVCFSFFSKVRTTHEHTCIMPYQSVPKHYQDEPQTLSQCDFSHWPACQFLLLRTPKHKGLESER